MLASTSCVEAYPWKGSFAQTVEGCTASPASLSAGYWDAKPEQLEKLRQLYTDVEDKIEGVEV